MWHEAAKPFVASENLAILGVVQEQHSQRAQLYKQWKQFEFPIVQDATTRLNLSAVPIPILIDEYGVVREIRPKPDQLKIFVSESYSAPTEQLPSNNSTLSIDGSLIQQGNEILDSNQTDKFNLAIEKFQQAVRHNPNNAKALFSLGVAFRMRYDSPSKRPMDFASATRLWSQSLMLNPNQYIWRRRIEQYGPRLNKPYPFYDWVEKAIAEITERGDKPIQLQTQLTGSEVASPSRTFTAEKSDVANPDPDSKILVDDKNTVSISTAVVPEHVAPGESVRVYLNFQIKNAKWNNEAGPMKIWISENSHGKPESRLIEYTVPQEPNSNEERFVDFEFMTSKTDGKSQPIKTDGFVLFHSCDKDGVCFYYRQNFVFIMQLK